jgi:CheY-like chemotaxis protein
MHVLFVSGDESCTMLFREVFAHLDSRWVFFHAASAEEALTQSYDLVEQTRTPQLIIVDSATARTDGYGFIRTLKAHKSLKIPPIICFSTSMAPGLVDEVYGEYCACLILLPANIVDRLDIVRNCLEFWTKDVMLPEP